MNFTKQTCAEVREALKKVLGPVAEKFQCSFEVGGISYGEEEMNIKIVLVKASPNKVGMHDKTAKFRQGFKEQARLYGLTVEDLKIVDLDITAKFVGIATSRSKYPFVFLKKDGEIVLYNEIKFNNVKKNYLRVMSNRDSIEKL